jgi:hypothetical protein
MAAAGANRDVRETKPVRARFLNIEVRRGWRRIAAAGGESGAGAMRPIRFIPHRIRPTPDRALDGKPYLGFGPPRAKAGHRLFPPKLQVPAYSF